MDVFKLVIYPLKESHLCCQPILNYAIKFYTLSTDLEHVKIQTLITVFVLEKKPFLLFNIKYLGTLFTDHGIKISESIP